MFTNRKLELGVRGVLNAEWTVKELSDFGVTLPLMGMLFKGVVESREAGDLPTVGVDGKPAGICFIGVLYEVGLIVACWTEGGVATGVSGVATEAHLDLRFCTADINLLNSHSCNAMHTNVKNVKVWYKNLGEQMVFQILQPNQRNQ